MFQISDIEIGDWVLVNFKPFYSKWIHMSHFTRPIPRDLVIDICKQNKQAQQDIISLSLAKEETGFDLSLMNVCFNKINNLVKNVGNYE